MYEQQQFYFSYCNVRYSIVANAGFSNNGASIRWDISTGTHLSGSYCCSYGSYRWHIKFSIVRFSTTCCQYKTSRNETYK